MKSVQFFFSITDPNIEAMKLNLCQSEDTVIHYDVPVNKDTFIFDFYRSKVTCRFPPECTAHMAIINEYRHIIINALLVQGHS